MPTKTTLEEELKEFVSLSYTIVSPYVLNVGLSHETVYEETPPTATTFVGASDKSGIVSSIEYVAEGGPSSGVDCVSSGFL